MFRSHECTVFTSALHTDPASLPPRRDLLGLGPSPVLSSTWQWIAFPRDPAGALRARRHSCVDPGELGHLPMSISTFGAPAPLAWDFRARVGAARRRPRSFRPMSAAHGCCFQRRSPHVSAHVASPCSHTMRELAVPRRNAHFGEPSDRARGVVFPDRLSAGVPLMLRRSRAPPVELCPPASARDRLRDLRS